MLKQGLAKVYKGLNCLVPEVKHMGNRTTIAESIQFNNNSPCRVKEFAADVCILDCSL